MVEVEMKVEKSCGTCKYGKWNSKSPIYDECIVCKDYSNWSYIWEKKKQKNEKI